MKTIDILYFKGLKTKTTKITKTFKLKLNENRKYQM